MKVLVADSLHDTALARLEKLCDELVVDATLSDDRLADAVADAEVLVVRSTKVPASVLARGKALSLVVRAGAGVNTIDVQEASRRGIFVANCPGKNAVAVAELAMGLLLALDRHIPDNVAAFRAGRWDKATFSRADGLAGRTVGVVGLGPIGRAFIDRIRGFGVRIVGWSRSLTDEGAKALGIERAAGVDDLFRRSDVVSLHLALVDATRGIVGRDQLRLLKPGAILLNTARAGLVDADALLDTVREGGLRVGLDVIPDEPSTGSGPVTSELQGHANVYVTHHIGASTDQAQAAVAAEVVRVITAYDATGEVPNCVNLRTRPDALHQLMVRHEDRVGVLAGVLAEISRHGVNVEEMDNRIFQGDDAACCFIRVATPPSPELMAAIESQPHVLGVTHHD